MIRVYFVKEQETPFFVNDENGIVEEPGQKPVRHLRLRVEGIPESRETRECLSPGDRVFISRGFYTDISRHYEIRKVMQLDADAFMRAYLAIQRQTRAYGDALVAIDEKTKAAIQEMSMQGEITKQKVPKPDIEQIISASQQSLLTKNQYQRKEVV